MRNDSVIPRLLLLLLLLAACATFESPAEFHDRSLRERAVTKTEEDIQVSAALPTAAEARTIFGIDLDARGIQPIWLEIENRSTRPVLLFATGFDPEYFAPLEVAFAYHRSFSADANARLDDHVQSLAFPYRAPILPDTVASGFMFTYQSRVSMVFDVDLVSRTWSRTVSMSVPVPGARPVWRADAGPESDRVDVVEIDDDAQLRAGLEALPCCTTDSSGAAAGLPLNLVLVGEIDDWRPAFARRGYRVGSTRPLYVFGRAQDVSGSKFSRWVTAQPHSVRLWLTPFRYQGKSVWIGQVSTVLGGRFANVGAAAPLTAPDVDESRDNVVADLLYSQAVAKVGFVSGVGGALPANSRKLNDGSRYYTDGLRTVLVFQYGAVALSDLDFFDWEHPAATSAHGLTTSQKW
jgi:hypothetical protein